MLIFSAFLLGKWVGLEGFDYSIAAYQFTFNNFAVSESQFNSFMESSRNLINNIGFKSSNQTLPINILYWMCWKQSATLASTEGSYLQELSFTGDPLTVFGTQLLYTVLRNKDVDCSVNRTASFDSVSGRLVLTINSNAYKFSKSCNSVVLYNKLIDSFYKDLYSTIPESLLLSIDIRTAVTALSVSILYIESRS